MTPTRDATTFRRKLAERVIEELSPDLSRVSAYRGPAFADTDDPDAQALEERGGTFEWVAFGFDPHSMWNAHIGVLTTDEEVTVGVHVHNRLSAETPPAVAALGEDIGTTYRYSETAAEHQFNRPAVPLEDVGIADLAGEIATLCRQFEPLVDSLHADR